MAVFDQNFGGERFRVVIRPHHKAVRPRHSEDDKIADLSTALVKLRASENAAQKVALAEEKNALAKEQLELSRAKFERDTTRLFIKWAQSKDALALATDKRLGSDEKTERLGRLMFGDLWESDK